MNLVKGTVSLLSHKKPLKTLPSLSLFTLHSVDLNVFTCTINWIASFKVTHVIYSSSQVHMSHLDSVIHMKMFTTYDASSSLL